MKKWTGELNLPPPERTVEWLKGHKLFKPEACSDHGLNPEYGVPLLAPIPAAPCAVTKGNTDDVNDEAAGQSDDDGSSMVCRSAAAP